MDDSARSRNVQWAVGDSAQRCCTLSAPVEGACLDEVEFRDVRDHGLWSFALQPVAAQQPQPQLTWSAISCSTKVSVLYLNI